MKIFLKNNENIIDICAIRCNNMDNSKRWNFNEEVESMKNFKKVLAVMFAVIMVFSLAACSGGSGEKDKKEKIQAVLSKA